MKRIVTTIVLIAVVINILGITLEFVHAAGPTFGTITVNPQSPKPQDVVTVTVSISGEVPSEVHVTVEECNENLHVCYTDKQNITMTASSTGTYQASVTLIHAKATNMTCIVHAKTNGIWSESAKKVVLLSTETPNGDGNNGKKTPAFELVPILIAIGISMIMLRRKRF